MILGRLVGSLLYSVVGFTVGSPVGSIEYLSVGSKVGSNVGSNVGSLLGTLLFCFEGYSLGYPEEKTLGEKDDTVITDGKDDGCDVTGCIEGDDVGTRVGRTIGPLDGVTLGLIEGDKLGPNVGCRVGCIDGIIDVGVIDVG